MRAPQPATVVIACPHCGTRYRLPPETLGASGRNVACANCGKSWLADAGSALPQPPPADGDLLFGEGEEAALDRAFAAAEAAGLDAIPTSLRQLMRQGEVPPPEVVRSIAEIKAALAPKEPEAPSPPADRAAQQKLEERQRRAAGRLPAARLFRVIRIAAVCLLCAIVVGGIALRTQIVRLVPEMAGVYGALGLGVNVVGLEFSDVSTVMSRRGGNDLISINATIRGVEPRRVVVPPVVVSLLDAEGTALYQWSVTPRARDVEPGEAVDFSTELAGPPAGATRVRLGFADGQLRSEAPHDIITQPQGTGH